MFNLVKFNDMWKEMDALMRYPFDEKTVENTGLRTIIKRPHNIINVKDKDGNVVGQRLEVVTTPFSKGDVKVKISDNVLTVECGSEKKTDESKDDYFYRGISSQSYTFSIRLGDKVDAGSITAKNEDGILSVNLPFINEESKTIEVTVE
jgi:Molecular chaperone (small heat shock protein)